MLIISHRGYWKTSSEKNSLAAFARSFSLAFGTETDLRDRDGELVISHDPAREEALPAGIFFSEYRKHLQDYPLALNIKSDGLQKLLAATLNEYQIRNYFVFDMSVPDMIFYIDTGLRVFTRQSEHEPNPVLYNQSDGIWIDCFKTDWVDAEIIDRHLNHGKQVCLVSPELHGRDFEAFWEKLARMPAKASSDLILCTDRPEAARNFFNE